MFFVVNVKRKFMVLLMCMIIFLITAISINQMNYLQADSMPKYYTVYLTFDDGPSGVTEKVLDVLGKYNVKATFFVIGETDYDVVSTYNRIIFEGHALGLHSNTHDPNFIYSSKDNYTKDFEDLRDLVAKSTGTYPKICRMVGGSNSSYCSKAVRKEILSYFNGNGFSCYDWDIDPHDSGAYALEANSLANNIIKAARKMPDQDLVILMHDNSIRKTLPDALEIIIPYFKDQGYSFDILSHDTILSGSTALVNNNIK